MIGLFCFVLAVLASPFKSKITRQNVVISGRKRSTSNRAGDGSVLHRAGRRHGRAAGLIVARQGEDREDRQFRPN